MITCKLTIQFGPPASVRACLTIKTIKCVLWDNNGFCCLRGNMFVFVLLYLYSVQAGERWFMKSCRCETHMIWREDRTTPINFSSNIYCTIVIHRLRCLEQCVTNADHEVVEALMCGSINLVWQAGRMVHSSLSHFTAVIHHAARVLPAVVNDWWDLLIPSSALP